MEEMHRAGMGEGHGATMPSRCMSSQKSTVFTKPEAHKTSVASS